MLRFISVLLFLSFSIHLGAQVPTSFEEAIDRANDISFNTNKDQSFPGLAVAVSYNGVPVWKRGYGYADISSQKQVDPDASLFRIGSVSKTLTAVALGQLISSDKVSPDADVRSYVTYFPEKPYPISVAQVAGHIGGIRHYRQMEFLSNIAYPDVRSGMEIFMHDALIAEPGEKYSYSSYGWNLISAIIEETSETPFLDYMKQQVFLPANMHSTFAEVKSESYKGEVSYYLINDGVNQIAPEVDNSYKWAGGGFLSTATDLLKFSDAIMDEVYFDKETLELMTTPQTLNNGKKTNYGMGWAINEDKKGRPWIGHSGGSVGGTTMFLVYPQYNLTIVTLVNQSSAKMDQLAWKVADQFISVVEQTER